MAKEDRQIKELINEGLSIMVTPCLSPCYNA